MSISFATVTSGTKLYKLVLWAAFLLFSVIITGCDNPNGAATENNSGNDINIVLAENPVPLASITIVAHQKGFFKNNGLNVEVKKFTSGKLSLDAVLAGGAAFGTVAETPVMLAGFANLPAVVLATTAYSNDDVKVVARKDFGINTPSDLKGKKVATFVGTSAEFFMNAFLEAHGMSASDLDVVSLRPPEMSSALIRGDIDAFFIWEPTPYKAKESLGDKVITFSGKEIYTETYNLATTQEFLSQNSHVVERVIQSLLDAQDYISNNSEDSIKIVSGYTGMDKKVLEEIWDNFNFQVVMEPFLKESILNQAKWALESGVVEKGKSVPNYDSMLNPSVLLKLRPQSVKEY